MAPDAQVLLAAVALPFLAAAVVPVAYRVLGESVAYACALVAAACFGLIATQFGAHVGSSVGYDWVPALGIGVRFYVDGLSLLVAFLASGVGVLVFTYSKGYMHDEPGQAKYYASLLAFMGSMLGLVLAADLVSLFVFWELTSLSSFSLIGHYQREDDSLYAARKSMLITVAGGLFLLVAFVVLYAVSGPALGSPTYDLVAMLNGAEAMREELRSAGLLVPVLLLLAVGAGAKSAQVPLHIWLPNAMEAPTPVSAFLHSATMVKAGVFLVGRFRPLLESPEWRLLFVALGLATMTVTAILAVAARDIKELLAYSTASHLGLIVAGFGFTGEAAGALGGETGAFHILNHAAFKAALFLVAGIVAHEAGTRALDDLGGLRSDLPVTAGVAAVAGLSMAGFPLFNGFYSKELLFEAAYEYAHHEGGLTWLVPAVAVFGSIFTFLYSIRFVAMFFGDRPEELGEVHRPPLTMLAPAVLLAVVTLAISVYPQGAVDVLIQQTFQGVVETPETYADGKKFKVKYPVTLKPALGMSAVTVAVGAVGYTRFGRIRSAIRGLLERPLVRADFWYDAVVEGADQFSTATVGTIQTGLLRTYATWAVGAFSALALLGYAATDGFVWAVTGPGPGITAAVTVVLLLAVVAALAVGSAPSHIAGVLTLSIVGFMIAIFYILSSAPDLALTQLLIETLVLVIFLLVLDRLPSFYGELDRSVALRDGVVSVLAGLTVFVTVMASTSSEPDDRVKTFLVENAGVPEEHGTWIIDAGGGGNVVNVILVDFRAFDTLGEISVIAMAALSVLTLIAMRDRGETQ